MQELFIGLLFILALAYLGWRGWKSFARKEAGCSKGCGCSTDSKMAPPNKPGQFSVKS